MHSCTLETATADHGVIGSDDVGCSVSNGHFSDSNAGTGKTVTATATLTGTAKPNYQLTDTSPTTKADITQRNVSASFSADNKVYDGTDAANVHSCTLETATADHGVIGSDDVGCSVSNGHFSDSNAGTGKTVTATATLTGTAKPNYQLTDTSPTTKADITQRNVSASFSADNKVYDGTDAANVHSCTLETATADHGVIGSDDVGCSVSNGHFSDSNAGTGKTVTATATLTGTAKPNYQLTDTSPTTKADITQRNVSASFSADNKVYDGTDAANVHSCTLETATADHGVIGSDDVGCSVSNGHFSDSNAGTGKTVTATATLTGTAKPNYQLTDTSPTTKADITQRNVSASFSADNKVYDGTDAANVHSCTLETATADHGVIGSDDVGCSVSNGHFSDSNAGTGKTVTATATLTGTAKPNYQLTDTSPTTKADITQRNVSASFSADNKVYDGTDAANVHSCTLETATADHGVIGSDDVGCSVSNGHFSDSNAGTGKTVTATATLTGTAKPNYQLTDTSPTTKADITQRRLDISAVTDSKPYDGGTSSSKTPTLGMNQVQGTDKVDGFAQAFASKNVLGAGNSTLNVTVYTIHDGNSGHNYDVHTHSAYGTITPVQLDISAVTDAGSTMARRAQARCRRFRAFRWATP